jgi:SPOR domain
MTALVMTRLAGIAGLCLMLAGSRGAARDLIRPAELPPPDYAGQQYVDSRGCLFLRAGTAKDVMWIARVTRKGQPVCGYPPSGNRVAIGGEAAAAVPKAAAPAATDTAPAGGLMVEVGRFALAANADRAEQQMGALGLPVARSEIERNGVTLALVFVGPFGGDAAMEAALKAVRGAGFPEAQPVRQ